MPCRHWHCAACYSGLKDSARLTCSGDAAHVANAARRDLEESASPRGGTTRVTQTMQVDAQLEQQDADDRMSESSDCMGESSDCMSESSGDDEVYQQWRLQCPLCRTLIRFADKPVGMSRSQDGRTDVID